LFPRCLPRRAGFEASGFSRVWAFTRLEVCATLAALGLLATAVAPGLAQNKPRSQQAVCANNLRLIGRAILLFDAEHGQADPWRVPRPPEPPATGIENNPWYQFSTLSNGLPTPRILACPSDTKVPAKDFSSSPDGGFLNPRFRNASVSYLLGLDSLVAIPDSVLGGDRNIQTQGFSACSSGLNPVPSIFVNGTQYRTAWTGGLHGDSGNLLFHDGRVEERSSQGLNETFLTPGEDNASYHLLKP